jgi:hypothetical protein
MLNLQNLSDVELLMEKSYFEQLGYAGEIQVLEIIEELERRWDARNEIGASIEEVEQPKVFILNNNRERKMSHTKAENLKKGQYIVTEVQGRGSKRTTKVEEVITVDNISTHFVLVNGTHKIKKSTLRVTFLGYGKYLA